MFGMKLIYITLIRGDYLLGISFILPINYSLCCSNQFLNYKLVKIQIPTHQQSLNYEDRWSIYFSI